MTLQDILLSEISQSQKDNIAWFHLYEVSKIRSQNQRWNGGFQGLAGEGEVGSY